MTTNAKALLNMPIITTSTGKEVGTVEQVLFDPGQHHLYGIVVKRAEKSDPALIVLAAKVKSYGGQAITIENEGDAGVFDSDDKAREIAPSIGHLGGTKVLTEDGNEVGKIDTVMINDDGSIANYRTAGGLLGLGSGKDFSPDQIVSAGVDAIIVRNAAVSA